MKKLAYVLVLMAAALTGTAQQSVVDLANDAQCENQDNFIKPILKSSVHPKRSLKANTWLRLSEAYANHTTGCGRDSTSAIKAWEALDKAAEVDTESKYPTEIDTLRHSELMYSAVMNQGVAHYNVGNMEVAAQLFLIGAQVDSDDTLSTFYAGIVSNQIGNTENAVTAFTQYIEVAGGKDPASYYTLASIAKENDDLETAIEWLKRGVNDTRDKDLQGELINTFIANDMLDDAIVDLGALVEQDPSNSNNLLNLGILYDNKGIDERNNGNLELGEENAMKALELYGQVLEIDPDNYDCNFNLAVFHFNGAVQIKGEVDAMDIKTYQEKGKEIEAKACAKFLESQPYFEACERIRPGEEEVTENLDSLSKVLAQCK